MTLNVDKILPSGLIDNHALPHLPITDTVPSYCSDGDDPSHKNWLIQAWKACYAQLTDKLSHPSDDVFVKVTKKKVRQPRKDYSGLEPSITTRLAASKIPRATISHRS